MENKVLDFKTGVFSLYTRRFGKLAELMIRKMNGSSFSKNISYDLVEKDKRIEVKFSRVLKKNSKTITETNVIEQVCLGNSVNRAVKQNNWNKVKFDSNIQQVKERHFDILYYGLFFDDVIEIFKLDSNKLKTTVNYSDHQHDGNTGEGQFHLNNITYKWHKKNNYVRSITYEELYRMLGGKTNG